MDDRQQGIEMGKAISAAGLSSAIVLVKLAESGDIDAVTAGEHATSFLEWQTNTAYAKDAIRRDGEQLYRCIQPHTSQDGWEPHNVPALWVMYADPADPWPPWSPPICKEDAYRINAQCTNDGKRWINEIDYNPHRPGVVGWREITNA